MKQKTVKPVVITSSVSLIDYLRQCISQREILYSFIRKDIALRYKYKAIGIGWAFINPLFATFLFSLVFGRIYAVVDNQIPYPVFTFLGYLFWAYFSGSLSRASLSLLNNRNLITKTYFPRLLLPVSSVFVGLLDFFLGLLVFIPLLFFYRIPPQLSGLFMLIPCLFLAIISSLGLGLFYSFLNTRYRDLRELIPYLNTFLYFLTPVFYSVRIIPKEYHSYLFINPMVGVVETIRLSMLTDEKINWQGFLISLLSALLLLFFGLYYFLKKEKELADII